VCPAKPYFPVDIIAGEQVVGDMVTQAMRKLAQICKVKGLANLTVNELGESAGVLGSGGYCRAPGLVPFLELARPAVDTGTALAVPGLGATVIIGADARAQVAAAFDAPGFLVPTELGQVDGLAFGERFEYLDYVGEFWVVNVDCCGWTHLYTSSIGVPTALECRRAFEPRHKMERSGGLRLLPTSPNLQCPAKGSLRIREVGGMCQEVFSTALEISIVRLGPVCLLLRRGSFANFSKEAICLGLGGKRGVFIGVVR